MNLKELFSEGQRIYLETPDYKLEGVVFGLYPNECFFSGLQNGKQVEGFHITIDVIKSATVIKIL